ncbi:MAG TPA: glycosyltransferase family 4 protein [Egibacteraceae bacterium]|jgi:glycosyltransferase involved in cell wall biosynthesis|nr:glycosyltransferase family 4 protein [Egibacteraceae bacterium]
MRIGLLAPPWLPVPPPLYGGTEAVIDRLARGFQRAGHEVMLFTTGDATCPVPRRSVLDFAESVRMGNAVVEQRHVAHAYEALIDCDIVHDHTIVGPLYSSRFPDLPVVTTNHGPFNAELGDVYRFIAQQVPLIAISHHQASTAGGVPIAGVIHHGLDVDEYSPGPGDGGYLLFLGRMAPDKGARGAAEVALAAGVPLLLAAKMREPLEIDYFNDQIRPLLCDTVTYVGEVGGAEKTALLAGARALLNPIRWAEPFGLVMIEALANGTPVITFPEGAASEIVDDGVTGIHCADEDEMVTAIDDIDKIDRAACRAAVEGHFSSDRMVAEHLALFNEVLSARS